MSLSSEYALRSNQSDSERDSLLYNSNRHQDSFTSSSRDSLVLTTDH